MNGLILLGSLEFWVNFADHLAHNPSELSFWEWVVLILGGLTFIYWVVVITIGLNRVIDDDSTPHIWC